MCTVSWSPETQPFRLLFTRDEQRTRSPAFPPAVAVTQNGVRYLAPTDPDAGGTWIAANEGGLIACLLNAYERPPPPTAPTRSRGTLIRALMETCTVSTAMKILQTFCARETLVPCYVLLSDRHGPPVLMGQYDHHVSLREMDLPMWTTSSFQPEEVRAWRTAAFRTHLQRGGDPSDFHHLECRENPAFGVSMKRPDARTVSLTRVERNEKQVTMWYRSVPKGTSPTVAIPLRSS